MSDALFDILRKLTTATITTMLLRKGIRARRSCDHGKLG
jgi:hypothetical protein